MTIIMKVVLGTCSLFFFMIGFDKIFGYLQPPCSLQHLIPTAILTVLGLLQVISGILLWFPAYRKHIAGFWAVSMVVFSVVHIGQSTYDIGGSAFMAFLLVIINVESILLTRFGASK